MGRLRNHTRKLNKANLIGGPGEEAIRIYASTLNTSGTITAVGNVQGANVKGTTSVSGATVAGNTGRFNTKVTSPYVSGTALAGGTGRINVRLTIPTTPYTAANVALRAVYATGVYMYLGRAGAWISGLFA